jgi:uncharacterized membrane protein
MYKNTLNIIFFFIYIVSFCHVVAKEERKKNFLFQKKRKLVKENKKRKNYMLKTTYNIKRGITITSNFHIDLCFDVKVSEDELNAI